MWKKGELVWANLRYPDTWIPGRVLDPSEPFGVLVSFFDLMEARYFPAPLLRCFERDFGALVSNTWRFRRFLNRALKAYFWNISYGLWCSCQPVIISPYFDPENSLPWFPLPSDSALGFLRNLAVSLSVPSEVLADANSSNAQILSFRRYIVDFERSESLYREIEANQPEAQDLSPDPSSNMEFLALDPIFPETSALNMGNSEVMSLKDTLCKDIPCSSSSEQPFQILCRNPRNLVDSGASISLEACNAMATSVEGGDGYPSERGDCDFVGLGNCTLNPEAAVEEITDEDTTATCIHKNRDSSSDGPVTADSEAASSHRIETSENVINSDDGNASSLEQSSNSLDMRIDEACLIEPAPCAVPHAWEFVSCSVNEADAYLGQRSTISELCSSMVNAEAVFEGKTDGNTGFETLGNLDSLSAEAEQVPVCRIGTPNEHVKSNGGVVAPAEQFSNLDATTNDDNQKRGGDNLKSIEIKRKASVNTASRNSFKKKRVAQESASVDKPLNTLSQVTQKTIATYIADSRCLHMKFLGSHDIPTKGDLLKKFSAFGKIDISRTDVYPCSRSVKIIFFRSMDAVAAYEYTRSKKVSFGQSKVLYWLGPFEQDTEGDQVLISRKRQEPFPTLKSCLKRQTLVEKVAGRRNLKVRFRMETNAGSSDGAVVGNSGIKMRENCSAYALDSLSVEAERVPICRIGTPNEPVDSNGGVVAPAEEFSRLATTTNDENQTNDGDNSKSIKMERKVSVNVASRYSLKNKTVAQEPACADKPLNPSSQVAQKVKTRRCLRLKYSRSHDLPTKEDLTKKFSDFGKIDASRTNVYQGSRSAKIVFLQISDAVAALAYAKSKIRKQDTEGNKVLKSWKPQEPAPALKSCLKKQTLADEGTKRRNRKVRFRMETSG